MTSTDSNIKIISPFQQGIAGFFYIAGFSQMHLLLKFLVLILSLSVSGCLPVSEFNQTATYKTISVKTDTLNLISKANENYANHMSEIDSLKLNVENVYQFSKSIPDNSDSLSRWEIIRDPQIISLFAPPERWKNKNPLSDAFISQVKILIAFNLNLIIFNMDGFLTKHRSVFKRI
jgi:hypothetical protein